MTDADSAMGWWLVKVASDPAVALAWETNRRSFAHTPNGIDAGLRRRFGPDAIMVYSFRSRPEAEAFGAGVRTGAGSYGAAVLDTWFESHWRTRA